MERTIYEYKNKIYAISNEINGKYIVIKSSTLPDGKKLVEEIRMVESESPDKVKRLIRLGRFKNFEEVNG